ncbi:MAG: outer membrane beta-barrel protein [Coxiellaceae bacterium]|nr:outer membrane beta-barrel protein [Coxiellaceae bacterium]
MKTINALIIGLLTFLAQPVFAEEKLPSPSENISTPSAAVLPLSYDKKDSKRLYGAHLAQNTAPDLPAPQARDIATDVTDKNSMENAHLAPPAQTETPLKNSVDIYATGGAGFANLKTDGTIHGEFESSTVYNANSTSTNGVYSAAAAYTFKQVHKKPIDISLGAAFVGTTNAQVNGTSEVSLSGIQPISVPYNYDVSSKAAFFEQRATYHSDKNPNWQPYIVTGFGPSWNTLSNFSGFNGRFSILATQGSHALGAGSPRSSQPFANETTGSFAYEAGVGILHPLSDRLAITADYRYINFGKGELGGLSLSPEITDRLSTNPISENTVLLSLKASFTT